MLDERRPLGLDGQDEMWDGVLHMVPPAGGPQRIGAKLLAVLLPLADDAGWSGTTRPAWSAASPTTGCRTSCTAGLRTCPNAARRGPHWSSRIRSAGDETYQKIDSYAALGVRELLIVHAREHRVELLRAVDRRLLPVTSDASGTVRSEVLDVGLGTVGEALRITWADGSADL